MTTSILPPNLGERKLQSVIEITLKLQPHAVYTAWTEQLDRWLATPGTVLMRPEVDTAFYFETGQGEDRQPYYGRFVRLEMDKLLEFTWLSTGTQHTETVITITLTPVEGGTQVHLTHTGFPTEELRDAHVAGWPMFLAMMESALATPS